VKNINLKELNLNESKNYEDLLIKNRRDLHKIPELGFQEFKTSKYIYEQIKDFVDEIYNLATTGIVAYIYANPKNKKTLLLRADIDALPIKEENEVDYKSTHEGVMHACGHDAHSSILINTIKYFSKNKDKLKMNLKFIFQPGEEGYGGAKKMIEEGVLNDVDYAVALHVWNDLEVGKAAVSSGPSMASSDSFEIELIGKGGHAAIPNQANDPILLAIHFINYCYSYFPRAFDNSNNYILTFTYINAGTANNIIPDKLILKGTVRAFDENIRIDIASKFEHILKTFCNLSNIDYILKYNLKYPVLVNDPFLYKIAYQALEKIQIKIEKFKSMGSEDMAYILQKVPGIYVAIGSKDEINNYPHHNPKFNINEKSMLIGMQFFINFVYLLQENIK
jgi:amidohydrolase